MAQEKLNNNPSFTDAEVNYLDAVLGYICGGQRFTLDHLDSPLAATARRKINPKAGAGGRVIVRASVP